MRRPKEDVLDEPVLQLTKTDVLDVRALCEGVFITGSPGSGKTTCSGHQLGMGLLAVPNMGGVIFTTKGSDSDDWRNRIAQAGRTADLIDFSLASGHCYDPIHYERTRSGRGANDPENLIEIFSALSSNGKKESAHGDNLFFERATEQLMRNAIVLLDLAHEPISIVSIDRLINSLPTAPGQHDLTAWQDGSFCATLINQVRERQQTLTSEEWENLEVIAELFFNRWPAMDERPRSSIVATWSGTADRFLLNPYRKLFSSGRCTFTPEMICEQGKLLLVDFPMLAVGVAQGRLVNTLIKICFTRAFLRRDLNVSANPIFTWQDEGHYYLTKQDNFVQQTGRGSRLANIVLTQNLLNISEENGENQLGSKSKSYLGNFGTMIFHQQNEVETAQYGADLIGKSWRPVSNFNASAGGIGQSQMSAGHSLQLTHLVEATEFTRLLRPDALNPLSGAIVHRSSTFNATKTERDPKGRNYISVCFSRE
jgi:hypothetical protein